ncbi:MAG: acyltransferase [Gammaproteobacteria bacterium]|nr:acyltransferase [Gammaproteobacteria bacterium]
MKVKLKLAQVGMNMETATIVAWLKQPGETFNKGEPLYEIETEKVTQEIESPGDGRLLEILVAEDEDADVGQEVCVVDLEF